MEIKFANEWMPTSSIDIPDLGQFYLEAIDGKNQLYYYLMVKTTMGTCSIMSYGPIVPDVKLLPNGYSSWFQRREFSQKQLTTLIDRWLNDKYKNIAEAKLITEDEFYKNYVDVGNYMQLYSDEVY